MISFVDQFCIYDWSDVFKSVKKYISQDCFISKNYGFTSEL